MTSTAGARIRELISRLDMPGQQQLERALRFCVQQHHAEVGVEHLLMQMLDQTSNPLNRLLAQYNIEPLRWMKFLVERVQLLPLSSHHKPVFSGDLLRWLEHSKVIAVELRHHDSIETGDLVLSLLRNPGAFELAELPSIRELQLPRVASYFNQDTDLAAKTQEQPSVDQTTLVNEMIEEESDDDGTLLMSAQEIEQVSSPPPSTPSQPPVIDGYGDLEKIGEGGMASVYRARHLGLQRQVALKILKPGTGASDEIAARFLREARIVARLSHPNIIQIYDINQVAKLTYLAMEFISGGELAERLQQAFSIDETVSILSQVLAALQCAHASGFIHRDIKPANILFRQDGTLVLTDFGIARAMDEDDGMTLAGSVVGTPRYMSPEQARGETLDHRSDLYSVGVLFYQMIEGSLPYLGESAMATAMKHILEPVPTLSPKFSEMQSFIERAMAKSSDDRFQSASEMIAALDDLPRL